MPRYADILPCLGRDLGQTFTYALPIELRQAARPGMQALVPLGTQAAAGIVAEIHDRDPGRPVKPVSQVFPEAPGLDPDSLAVARWMADYYWCSLPQAVRCFLPEGSAWQVTGHLEVTEAGVAASPGAVAREHPEAGRVLRLLLGADGQVALAALERTLGEEAAARAVAWLRRRGLARVSYRPETPQTRARREQVVSPALPAQALRARAEALPARQESRARLLCYLADHPQELTPAALAAQAGAGRAVVAALVREGVLAVRERPVRRRPWGFVAPVPTAPVRLSEAQRQALAAMLGAAAGGEHQVFLLHGATASGKSEVFLRAAEWVVGQGRQVMILVPEIALSAQLFALLEGRFGGRVALLHSALSPGERYDEWQRIRAGEADVVLGARSAVFAPAPRLGLVVVDEEHEDSYKQDHDPRYHARAVAIERARRAAVPVVLSSATPSLESYQAAQDGRYRLLTMEERVAGRALPTVQVVDLRHAGGRRFLFDPRLVLATRQAVDAGKQVILFVNRRGYANFLLCTDCGYVPCCPDCDLSFTYHLEQRSLRCHHCGAEAVPPEACPRCAGRRLEYAGFGTERVEQELARVLPGVPVARMDRDTTSRRGSHARLVSDFREEKTRILVGTQMVAKGFDFPGVTLVGVLCADLSLRLPDFRAGERTFQLITQVSGRAGRGEAPGAVLIQTYDPEHYALQAALRADYASFFAQEAASRREHGFPPFAALTRLLLVSEDAGEVEKEAGRLASALEAERPPAGRLLGPSPAPLARIAGKYRWHLLLLAPGQDQVAGWLRRGEVSPGRQGPVSLAVDVDPTDTM